MSPSLGFWLLAAGLASAAAWAPEAGAQNVPLQISADQVSGTHGPEGDIVNLNGNVKIVRGRTVITSNTGVYRRAQGLLDLVGDVKVVDSTTTITCEQASYSEHEDVVQLSGNVVARDRDAVLRSPSAVYDRRAGRADMYGGVRADHKNQRMTSDRAVYFRDSAVVHARGHVVGEDVDNRSVVTADEMDYDRNTSEAVARGKPALTAKDEDGNTSVIRARLLRFNSETHVAEAVDSVHVVRDTLQATADYGLFDDEGEVGWLLGNPRAWDQNTTVTGDTLQMLTEGRQLERVIVRHRAAMEYRGAVAGGAPGDTSRLTGQRVDVFFTGQNIDSLVAVGDARNEYRGAPQPGKTAESNLATGDTIKVFFDDREIDRARVTGNAKGEYNLAVAVGDTTAAASEVVRYDAETIEFVVPKKRIVLDPAAHLIYKDLELKARRVEFDSEKQVLVAEGSPELVDRGDRVTGHLMSYDLETRVGNIYQAETEYEKGLYHGEQIRKVSENELDVKGGDYSTCNRTVPHYHFSARYMKIYLKDKLVAKPVVFYVKNVPLLALPFWIFPIRPGRHSGFLFPQVELGFSNRAGRFIRNAGYYWAPNDYFDVTLSGDYYQAEPSWVGRIESFYKLQYVLDGSIRASYARNEGNFTENWDLDADHIQELSPRTRLAARASFISSRDYNSSNLYGRTYAQRLNRFLTSNLAVTHNADWASFSGALDRRQDLDADQALLDPDGPGPDPRPPVGSVAPLPNLTENLPSLALGFPTRVVGSLPVMRGTRLEKWLSSMYFSLGARYLSFRERRAYVAGTQEIEGEDGGTDSINVLGQSVRSRNGFASTASLSDARRLFGWLNMRPSITGDVAVFDFDELGNRVVPAGVWSASVTGGTTVYGTFLPRIGPLTGLRHIVTPSVSFSYSPDFDQLTYIDSTGTGRPRFASFGGIGIAGFRRQRMDFSVDQRLQVRLGSGDKVRKLDNLVAMQVAGSYNFLYKEQNQPHPLSPLVANLFLQPPTNLSGSANALVDVYAGRPLRSLSFNTGFDLVGRGSNRATTAPPLPAEGRDAYYENETVDTFEDRWSLGLAYSYSGGYQSPVWSSNQTMNIVARYRMTPAWLIDYVTSYDITNRSFGIQQFSLSRDLHCWVAQFTRTFAYNGETEYYFRLSVKDQKELFVERGTRTGSIGGIN